MKTSKAKVKILHIINGEFFSGAERVQDVLALSLPDYGYEVGFVSAAHTKVELEKAKRAIFDALDLVFKNR